MQSLYTCDEIAIKLSVKVPTVWEWIRKKKLGAYKIGRAYQVSEEQLNSFMNSCLKP